MSKNLQAVHVSKTSIARNAAEKASPREQATAAVARLEACKNLTAAAFDRRQATTAKRGNDQLTDELDLEQLEGDIAIHEAKYAEKMAFAEAQAALHSAELAEGDEDARLVATLHADLSALEADAEQKRAELAENAKAFIERVERAKTATTATAARRASAGLPPPAAVPVAPHVFGSLPGPKDLLRALADRATNGGAPTQQTKNDADRLRNMKGKLKNLQAAIEERRLAAEERARLNAEYAKEKELEKLEAAKRQTQEHNAWVAKCQAEQKRADDLAAAYRARTGT